MTRAGARNLAAIESEVELEVVTGEEEPEDVVEIAAEIEDQDEPESPDSAGKHKPQFTMPARIISGVAAAILVVMAYGMPIWVTKLKAPQYPAGLELTAYGNRVTGDVFEVDTLNHYVGMRAFHFEDVPEAKLWPVAILLGLAAAVISTMVGRKWMGRLARLYLWLLPVGVLLDVQYRLYYYGHHLDPAAALRMKPFTPLVLGPTKVWNFTAWSMPGTALIFVAVAAAVLSFGPLLLDRLAFARGQKAETNERADEEAP